MLKIIVAGLSGQDARVLNSETGEDIGRIVPIRDISLSVKAGGLAQAQIFIDHLEAQQVLEDHVEWLIWHPLTGNVAPVAAIEFRDGARIEFPQDAPPRVAEVSADPVLLRDMKPGTTYRSGAVFGHETWVVTQEGTVVSLRTGAVVRITPGMVGYVSAPSRVDDVPMMGVGMTDKCLPAGEADDDARAR